MPEPAAGQGAPPQEGGRSPLLDEILQDILGEVSKELRRITGDAVGPPAAAPKADAGPSRARQDEADVSPAGAGGAAEELSGALTEEERRTIQDLMRQEVYRPAAEEPAPAGQAALPVGSLQEDAPAGEAPHPEPVPAPAQDRPSQGKVEEKPPDTSAIHKIPPIPQGEDDAGILEVEDLIRMHLDGGALPGAADRERSTEPMLEPTTVFGPVTRRPTWLERFDQWVIRQGLAPYKRAAGLIAWAILIATLVAVAAVTAYRNR